jgi:hypothetical protein
MESHHDRAVASKSTRFISALDGKPMQKKSGVMSQLVFQGRRSPGFAASATSLSFWSSGFPPG